MKVSTENEGTASESFSPLERIVFQNFEKTLGVPVVASTPP